MKKFAMRASALAVLALCQPVFANEIDDLKAEIAAQKRNRGGAEGAARCAGAAPQRGDQRRRQACRTPSPSTRLWIALAMTTDQNGVKLVDAPSGVALYNNGNTSLHMYGLIEATGSHANHQTTGGGSTTGFQVAWFSGNRLGFDADHALAIGDRIGLPGLKVISKLETEFELPTGDMDTSDVFFNRDAWMGFYSEDLGKLTFGRQNTLTRDFTQTWGDAVRHCRRRAEGRRLLQRQQLQAVHLLLRLGQRHPPEQLDRLEEEVRRPRRGGPGLRLRLARRRRQRRRRQRRLDAGRLQEGQHAGSLDRDEQRSTSAPAC